jgi:Flp pilus assembly protein TadG
MQTEPISQIAARLQRILKPATRLLSESNGSVAVIAAFCFVAVAVCAGTAVDFVRASRQRQALSAAVDAAALALASSKITDTAQLQQLAEEYIKTNFNSVVYTGSEVDLNIEVEDDRVAVTARQTMPTTLMKLARINTMNLQTYAEASRGGSNVEIVLVLDNTGSMGRDGKLESLQSAAVELTDILFGSETISDSVKMAIVPFSVSVNVGPQYTSESWLDHNGLNEISHLNFKDASKHNSWAWNQLANMDWNGCVEQRKVAGGIDYDIDDTVPTTDDPDTLFPIYFAPDEPTDDNGASNLTGWGSFPNSYLPDWRSDEKVSSGAKKKTELDERQRRDEKYVGVSGVSVSDEGPAHSCGIAPLTPLTGTKQTITEALANMSADGYTNIAAGVGWGLRVLSPTIPFTEGASYTDEDWKKVMIVMTDGSNDWGAELSNMNNSYYGGYGYTSQSAARLGMTSILDRDGVLDERTAAACNEAKTAGDVGNPITVYTITFGSPDGDAIDLMRECASDSEKYFHAPDEATLSEAFETIGSQISRVYLSK